MMTERLRCAFLASGGGLKGYAFHLGVLRALEDNGFRRKLAAERREAPFEGACIDTYIGSSAGACVSAAAVFFSSLDEAEMAIGMRPGKVPRFGRRVLFRPNLSWLRGRRCAGLFRATGVERYFRDILAVNDFRQVGPELFICATQLNSSRKVIFGPIDSASGGSYSPFIAYYNDVPISEAIAASVSVPGLFAPYPITNRNSGELFEYTDGEVRETHSVHIARDRAIDVTIVSNVWIPYSYDAGFGSVSGRGLWPVVNQSITQMIEQKVDLMRNAALGHREVVATLKAFGATQGLPPATMEALVERVSALLKYRPMEQIYVAPDRSDSRFILSSSWKFDAASLTFARDVGYRQAQAAILAWRTERAASG